MEYVEETAGQVKIFHLGGKIMGDAPTQALCHRLHELIDAGTRTLVMDFRQVRWINSTGIGVIIACLNAIRERGGDIRFANLHDASAQYFHISKLETVVQMFDDVEAAIASFGE